MTELVYFKDTTLVEPLFNQWYAWPYLIPPASAAMFVANSHLKIMESFISAPKVHIAALRDPAMLGGPFINYDAGKVGQIRALADETIAENADLLEFAAAVKVLDDKLAAEATGYSLEAVYQEIPAALRGYVELVYDLRSRASVRFVEGLLYKSRYYRPERQSLVLSNSDSDGRPFVFSTPRLKSDGQMHVSLSFSHEAIDELFRMEFQPQPLAAIKEVMGLASEDYGLSEFFTREAPPKSAAYNDEAIRIRYFGHACLLVQTKAVSVLCDPVISRKKSDGQDRYTYADLPEVIDYVLLTHTHQDHVMFESLLRLRHKIKNVIVPKSSGGDRMDPSLKLLLQTLGFTNVYDLDELESIEVAGGSITGLPFFGEHADLNIRTKLGYRIELDRKSILLLADSNNIEPHLYRHLREVVGSADIIFLGMECDGAPMSWLYGPLLTTPLSRKNDQSRRFDGSTADKGMLIVDELQPSEVYVYAMGQEPWCTFLTSLQYTNQSKPIVESDELVARCQARGIIAERLFGQKELIVPAD